MQRHAPPVLLLAALLAAVGCDPPDLTPSSEVIRLRVLAIETEPAEIEFGDEVVLHPVIADPWDEGYSVQWMPCISADLGGFVACDFENMLIDLTNPFALGALTEETLVFTVDQQAVAEKMAERGPLSRADGLGLQFILMLLPRGKTFFDYMPELDPTQIDDPDYLEQYAEDANAALQEVFEALIRQSRIAYKRVLVTDTESVGLALHTEGPCADLPGLLRNDAPALGGLIQVIDGVEYAIPSGSTLSVPAGTSVELEPLWNGEDQQHYYHVSWEGVTECRQEQPYFGWYATDGGYSAEGFGSSDYSYLDDRGIPYRQAWNAPAEVPVRNPVDAWLVVWDRRGGIHHVEWQFEVTDGEEP